MMGGGRDCRGGVRVSGGGNAGGETWATCEMINGTAINGGAINDKSSSLAAGGGFPPVSVSSGSPCVSSWS